VSNEEIAQRVKYILDVEQPDWIGVPLSYHAENPPPQVKARSLLTCFLNNLDVYLIVRCQDVVPLGTVARGMDIGSDDEDNPKGPATGLASTGETAQAPNQPRLLPSKT
jgi:hypothetical protein